MISVIAHILADVFNELGLPDVSGSSAKSNFLSLFYTAAGIAALFLIIWAAFKLTKAGDNAKERESAWKTITYAFLGLFLVLVGTTIFRIILGVIK